MIDRIDAQPTHKDVRFVERRSGKERRKIHTMLDPQVERRKGTRRGKKETTPGALQNSGHDADQRVYWVWKDL